MYPKVTLADFNEAVGELYRLARRVREGKREGYTLGDENVLANFDRQAARRNISPETVIQIFMDKHLDAIASFFSRPDIFQAEEIDERFADALNYLIMLWVSYKRGFTVPTKPSVAETYEKELVEEAVKKYDKTFGVYRKGKDGFERVIEPGEDFPA